MNQTFFSSNLLSWYHSPRSQPSPLISPSLNPESPRFLGFTLPGSPRSSTRPTITDKGIILDLDETLVRTFSDISQIESLGLLDNPKLRSRVYHMELQDVAVAKGEGQITQLWGVVRPHVHEFLKFCFSYFKVVAVWSAGKKEYVHAIVELLFRDIRPPDYIYTNDHCHIEDAGDLSKPLNFMFTATDILRKANAYQVIILDDRLDVCRHNQEACITIPPYSPEASVKELLADEQILPILINWLMRPDIVSSKNLWKIDKKRIFSS